MFFTYVGSAGAEIDDEAVYTLCVTVLMNVC